MITWVTGNMNSGKTRTASAIVDRYGGILLDGNDMRQVWPGLGLDREGRWEQNLRLARLASLLDKQGHDVVVASICPYRELRDKVHKMTGCRFIYCDGGEEPSEEYPYER